MKNVKELHTGWMLGISVVVIALLNAGWPQRTAAQDDPSTWEEDIAAFEADAAENPPPENAVLFIGSSSIRLWETLHEDMAPLPVIQRGFGGSRLGDAIYYIDRIVTPYAPRAIVIFSGSNDIAGDTPKQPEEVFALYKQFVTKVHESLPGTPIFFIAITPTWSRWEHKDLVARANALIEEYSATTPTLHYIDTASSIVDEKGEPKKELFREDQLHLNAKGYAVWTSVIKPVLIASFSKEAQDN